MLEFDTVRQENVETNRLILETMQCPIIVP